MDSIMKVEVLRAACCVAGIDGETTPAERKMLEKLAGGVGVGKASLNAMIDRAENDPNFYKEQFDVLKGNPEETMEILINVAVVDNQITQNEAVVLKRLSQKLDVSDETFESWIFNAAQRVNQNPGDGAN